MEIQQGCIITVLIEIHGIALKEQVDLPGFEVRTGNGAQVSRYREFLLPPIPVDK